MFRKTKIAVASVGIVGLTCVGCYYMGSQNGLQQAENERIQAIEHDNQQQANFEEKLREQNVRANNFIAAVEQQVDLILTYNNGFSNLKLQRSADKWNSWITESSVDVTLEVKAAVGIPTEKITFIKTSGGAVSIHYNESDIQVLSLEILNQNIISERKLFGKGFTDAEKVATIELMQEQVKEKVIKDNKVLKQSKQALNEYLYRLAEQMEIDIQIVGEN